MNSTLTEISDLEDSLKSILLGGILQVEEEEDPSGRKVYGTDTIRPQTIIYGTYVGRFYYENQIDESPKTYTIKNYVGNARECALAPETITYEGDKVIKTTVDKLINYIDIDARFDKEQLSVNRYWDESGTEAQADTDEDKLNGLILSLNGLISKETLYDETGQEIETQKGAYRKVSDTDPTYYLLDEKDRKFVSPTRSNIVTSTNERIVPLEAYRTTINNYKTYLDSDVYKTKGRVEYNENSRDTLSIYNPQQSLELLPEAYDGATGGNKETEMYITVAKYAASDTDANQLKIDDLSEILVYSNSVGRKDKDSVPGNALKISTRKGMWEAGYNSYNPEKTYDPLWLKPEDDAYSPEYVTITAPTGIAQRDYIRRQIAPIVAISIFTGIAVILIIAIKRKK